MPCEQTIPRQEPGIPQARQVALKQKKGWGGEEPDEVPVNFWGFNFLSAVGRTGRTAGMDEGIESEFDRASPKACLDLLSDRLPT